METYIVRIWRDEQVAEQASDAHGVVRHVASGREQAFRSFDQLLIFLRDRPTSEQARAAPPAERHAAAD